MKKYYFLSLTKFAIEYKIIEVINNIVPKIIVPIANRETFVTISLVSEKSWRVKTVKINPIIKNAIPGIP